MNKTDVNMGTVAVDRGELEDYIIKHGTWVTTIPGWVSASIYGVVVGAAILWYIYDADWWTIAPIGALGIMYHIITAYDSKFCNLWNTHEYFRLIHDFGHKKMVEHGENQQDPDSITENQGTFGDE